MRNLLLLGVNHNVPYLRGGGHTDYNANPIGFGVGIGVCVTLSCLHNIMWTSSLMLTKFSLIRNWGVTKNWFDFGDLDLIFKVTAVKKLKIHGVGTSVFSENTVTSFLLRRSHFRRGLVCKKKKKKKKKKNRKKERNAVFSANCVWSFKVTGSS